MQDLLAAPSTAVLDSLATPVVKNNRELMNDLRAELAAAGLGRPVVLKSVAKFLFLLAIAAGCLVLGLESPWLTGKLAAAIVGTWFLVSAVMCGHDGSHQAISPTRWVNDLHAWFAFTALAGLSNAYWRDKHNLKHHPFCNINGRDPDVDQFPFALSRSQHEAASGPKHFLQRTVQAWLFYPLVFFFLVPLMRWAGVSFAVREIFGGRKRVDAALDLVFVTLHAFLWIGAPLLLGASWLTVATVYLATTFLGGLYLAFIFGPAHMVHDVVSSSSDQLLLQLQTTRNYRTNWFFSFTLVGLDHQIEHHLAAKISHFDLPRARPIVQAFCQRHGFPYHESSWLRAILDTHVHLARAWDLPEIVVGDPPLARA